MNILLICEDHWSVYAAYTEDKKLRKQKLNMKYDGKQIVMWDDTNIPFNFQPDDKSNQ